MHFPRATYRVQFHPHFRFQQARELVSYLHELGVSDLYGSPLFQARRGSQHGYDVVDPSCFNVELGSFEDFEVLHRELQAHEMGYLQDIVPNHMAFHSENAWLMDVFENGPHSEYLPFFDIEWDHPLEGLHGRVLVPLLGDFYGKVLERGELRLTFSEEGFALNYWEQRFPLCIESYADILSCNLEALRACLGQESPEFVKFLGVLYLIRNLPPLGSSSHRAHELRFVKRMLGELYATSAIIHEHIERLLTRFNGTPGIPESFNDLEALHRQQHFRLAYWKVASEEINYRRFFTVNELICVRVEDPLVFDRYHAFIKKGVEQNFFQGLRVDHLDGLFDPDAYLERLRQLAPQAYLIVEKILEPHEVLSERFPIQGTTGYTFLNEVNALFVCQENEAEWDRTYQQWSSWEGSEDALLRARKYLVLDKSLAADITRIAVSIRAVSNQLRLGSDMTFTGLQVALKEIIACFTVYRTYLHSEEIDPKDGEYIRAASSLAQRFQRDFVGEIQFVEKFLLMELPSLSSEDKANSLHAIQRFQQLTGPVMAKGVEDNFFYVYTRLLSLNEVGSNPKRFGVSPQELHSFFLKTQQEWPHTLNATSTHDTKRGEDARARLNVLSEFPLEWEKLLRQWGKLNADKKRVANGREVPERPVEYFLYQAMLGSLPFTGSDADDFPQRFHDYLIKAMREASVSTSWLKPDKNYENACEAFLQDLFDQQANASFWRSFHLFAKKISFFGLLNSLSQVLLKITAPGIPDFYQGSELWDFSMVDPDNRRPVDFSLRRRYLDEVIDQLWHGNRLAYLKEVLSQYQDGRVKLLLMHIGLWLRRDYAALFEKGDYCPLKGGGKYASHFFAFTRSFQGQSILVVVPRLLSRRLKVGQWPLGTKYWEDTYLHLPSSLEGKIVLSDQVCKISNHRLFLADILAHFPVGLCLLS